MALALQYNIVDNGSTVSFVDTTVYPPSNPIFRTFALFKDGVQLHMGEVAKKYSVDFSSLPSTVLTGTEYTISLDNQLQLFTTTEDQELSCFINEVASNLQSVSGSVDCVSLNTGITGSILEVVSAIKGVDYNFNITVTSYPLVTTTLIDDNVTSLENGSTVGYEFSEDGGTYTVTLYAEELSSGIVYCSSKDFVSFGYNIVQLNCCAIDLINKINCKCGKDFANKVNAVLLASKSAEYMVANIGNYSVSQIECVVETGLSFCTKCKCKC